MKRNYIAIVLDNSGSMGHLRAQVIDTYNSMLRACQTPVEGQETFISLTVFDDFAHTQIEPTRAADLRPLKLGDYVPRGSTALFDGVGKTIDLLDRQLANQDTSYLVMVITDGEENMSRNYNSRTLMQLLDTRQKTDRWTFAFQLPRGGYAARFKSIFHIPDDNVREWETTAAGMQAVNHSQTTGITNYMAARASGQTAVRKFYQPVTTDLSQVDPKELKKKLVDVSAQMKSYTVEREIDVKTFIESKTGKPYVLGSAYYQLMKREEIQPSKGVLIMEKGGRKVYGGNAARQLIGLPDNQYAKVSPGNHSDYDIYVQSASVNRKLVRGTKVLLQTTHVAGVTPTWDHTAIAPTK